VHFELKIKASGGNNFIDFPENQLTKFRFRLKWIRFVTLSVGAFLFYLQSFNKESLTLW